VMSGPRTIATVDGNQLVDVAIPATITGGTTLLETGVGAQGGTLALGGTSTFSGAVTVNAGTLTIPGGGVLNATGGVSAVTTGTLAGGRGSTAGPLNGKGNTVAAARRRPPSMAM